jgi:hypothetical protein
MAASLLGLVLATWPVTADVGKKPEDGIRTELISDPDYWQHMGYAEMVPSLRLPTTHDATDIIRVYLRLPARSRISAHYLADQNRYTLLFPPGTRADRVESLRYRDDQGELRETPVDVRGTLIETSGEQRFHTLRPTNGKPAAPLLGWSWPAGDTAAREEATRRIVAFAEHAATPLDSPPLSGSALRALRRLSDCTRCHVPNHRRASSTDQAPLPRRETDGAGFYVPLTVLESQVAVAATRPLDLNADDPFVHVRCGEEPARLAHEGEWTWYRCADGSVPIGRRDVRAALAAGDAYTKAVCRSRRYLYDHMDAAAREAFAPSFEECGIRATGSEASGDDRASSQNKPPAQ